MSFILDALKKSETERQQQSSAEFAAVPTSERGRRVPRWLWVLGLLLAFNLLALLGLLLRPSGDSSGALSRPVAAIQEPLPETVMPKTDAASLPAADKRSFEDQVAVRKQTIAERAAAEALDTTVSAPAGNVMASDTVTSRPAAADVRPGVVYTAAPSSSADLPTFQEVRANGAVTLPDLHLDIHVYSDVPADRFVFINMSKQREKSRLAEGPLVEEITPQGVVLEYQGTSFLLARD